MRAGATLNLRMMAGRPSTVEATIDSDTPTPETTYSSTGAPESRRRALKRPSASGIGPRPTSSGLGAGSRGSVSDDRSPACQPG